MTNTQCVVSIPPDLRERAESAVGEENTDIEHMTPDHIREMIHILKVDRAELEYKK